MTVLYWLPNYNHQNRYASKNHWVDFVDLHSQTSLYMESNNKSMWQNSETNEKRSVSTVLSAFPCLHIIYFDGNGFCCKLFSLSLSLWWAQWEDNCGIHVGIPLCQMPGPLNLIQLMHSNVSDGPQKLIAIRCVRKISESLMHYSGYYVDISEARVCLQPVHPRMSCEVMTYWFGSKRKMAQWSERAI